MAIRVAREYSYLINETPASKEAKLYRENPKLFTGNYMKLKFNVFNDKGKLRPIDPTRLSSKNTDYKSMMRLVNMK